MSDGKLDLTETVGIVADSSALTMTMTTVSEEVVIQQQVEETPTEPTEENTEG